jgi:2-polyprenyl-6-methoxyphenol hydroxylase-like FAD-dependent oxidoreductase
MTMFWSLPVEALAADRTIDLLAWRRAAAATWPEAGALVDHAAAAGDFARATYRHVALPRWNEGPVLFIGDAAHGTSPQLGQGANLGLLDAHALFCALSESDDLASALALFAKQRSSTVRFYRQASHLVTPFFQSRLAPLGWLRDAFMGLACHTPGMRPLMGSTLAGTRRGWLASSPLDSEGRYPLSAPTWRSGPESGRSGPRSGA